MTFEELKEKALSLPMKPGVYLMMDQTGTVIYVGKAKALKNRVSQYFHDQASHTEKTRAMVSQIDHFDTIVVGSEFEALVLESSLIKRHKPRYNILLAKAEARAIIEDARRTADQVFRELSDMKKKAKKEGDFQAANDQRAGLRRQLNEAEDKLGAKEEKAPPPMIRPARKGDTVTILKTGTQGTVLSVNKDGVLQLQAGILRITAKQEEVRVVQGQTQAQKEAKKHIQRTEHKLRSLGAKAEVDLRGMMTDEAEMVLSQFIDRAIVSNLNQVTVIHGKGTGAVRKAVHTYLKRCKGVAGFRLGRYGEGETGVTIVELK